MSFSGELRGIAKAYGSCHANKGVDLHVRAGTIHALVGENGAGKSTAMKIMFGMVHPDSGEVRYDGAPVAAGWGAEAAFGRGIGMVHQHFMLAGPETVHDNLVLGAETTRFGLRDRDTERLKLDALMTSTGMRLPLDVPAESLTIGQQSRCEILKVLYRNASFLILDEPTAVLTPQEVDELLETLRKLRAQGKTILIVTHKLREVMAVADEATILRGGQTVATRKISETSAAELSELMVGRRLHLPKVEAAPEKSERDALVRVSANGFSVELRPGEITGIAGVEGNGQERLIEALTYPNAVPGLKLLLLGLDASKCTPLDLRKLPMAIVPADRHREGLVLDFSLFENLRLGRVQAGAKGKFGPATAAEKELLASYDVRPGDPSLPIRALSGGNQQKLIIARELGGLEKGGVVLAIHPTRGVDIGAIEFIHGRLLEAAANGAAILLVSSELDELMSLSHRIGVFYRGKITSWFKGPPYNEKEIGMAMLSGGAT